VPNYTRSTLNRRLAPCCPSLVQRGRVREAALLVTVRVVRARGKRVTRPRTTAACSSVCLLLEIFDGHHDLERR